MKTTLEWIEIYHRYKQLLGMPCVLNLSTEVDIAQHSFNTKICCITINPEVDFRRPEHLILHEFAHHRVCVPYVNDVLFFEYPENIACHFGWSDGHCEHWAQTLCDMYRETNTDLPFTTSFAFFAKAAGIRRQNFTMDGNDG